MKREQLTLEQTDAADAIFHELIGFKVSEAKMILKYIAGELENKAVVEQPLQGGD